MSSRILPPRRSSYGATLAAALLLSVAALASGPRQARAAEKAAAEPSAAQRTAKLPRAATSAEREHARQLVLEGDRHYERRELAEALDRYSRAYGLMRVPTVGIEVIKAQTALGKLVEAQATAQEVASSPRLRGEPAVFEEARRRAAQSNLRLTGMIPSLWLEVSPPGVVFEVEIDGEAPSTPPPYRLNPGAHEVRVKASGYQTRALALSLREAERLNRRAELVPERSAAAVAAAPASSTASARLPQPANAGAPAAAHQDRARAPATATSAAAAMPPSAAKQSAAKQSAATPPPAAPPAPASQPALAEDAAPAPPSSSLRSLGWVGLGVAVVAAGAGTYAGIRAFGTKPECPDDTCSPSQQDDIDASTRMGTIANVSVGVAVVAGALGIWALATSGEAEGEASASLRELPVTVGLGKLREIRISGRF